MSTPSFDERDGQWRAAAPEEGHPPPTGQEYPTVVGQQPYPPASGGYPGVPGYGYAPDPGQGAGYTPGPGQGPGYAAGPGQGAGYAPGPGQGPGYAPGPGQGPGYAPGPGHDPRYGPGRPADHVQAGRPAHAPEPRRIGREAGLAAAVAAVLAVLGLGMGPLWSAVAPWVPAIRTADGAVLAQPEQEQMIAAEGWYLAITILVGIAVAVLAWVLLRRYRGALILAGLAVGGVAAGVIAYKLGHTIGHAHAKYMADHAPVGTAFSIPPNLRVQQVGLWHGWLPYAKGDVLSMAIASVVTYLLFAGFSPHPTLRPAPAGEPSEQQPATGVSSGW